MISASTREPTSWPEGRRLRAWQLFQQGWKVGAIAEALGVTHSAISQWLARGRSQGEAALYDRKSPGRPSRLTPEQHARVPELLTRGAEAWGFRGALSIFEVNPRIARLVNTMHTVHALLKASCVNGAG